MSGLKRINYFDNREKCKEFLKQFKFKYFVPYVNPEELKQESKVYYIELTKDLSKVHFCSIQSLCGEFQKSVWNQQTFFDSDYAYTKNKDGKISSRYQAEKQGEDFTEELKEYGMNYYY
ncbi:hypothetical protein [Clostridium sp.]|jgi:hypothetical protein|uniref:hypothetical protein n=1 Tax=Clostridium sp. TaxID=1506 RepID=UPI00359F1DBC